MSKATIPRWLSKGRFRVSPQPGTYSDTTLYFHFPAKGYSSSPSSEFGCLISCSAELIYTTSPSTPEHSAFALSLHSLHYMAYMMLSSYKNSMPLWPLLLLIPLSILLQPVTANTPYPAPRSATSYPSPIALDFSGRQHRLASKSSASAAVPDDTAGAKFNNTTANPSPFPSPLGHTLWPSVEQNKNKETNNRLSYVTSSHAQPVASLMVGPFQGYLMDIGITRLPVGFESVPISPAREGEYVLLLSLPRADTRRRTDLLAMLANARREIARLIQQREEDQYLLRLHHRHAKQQAEDRENDAKAWQQRFIAQQLPPVERTTWDAQLIEVFRSAIFVANFSLFVWWVLRTLYRYVDRRLRNHYLVSPAFCTVT